MTKQTPSLAFSRTFIAALLFTSAASAQVNLPDRFSYAAKFVCGTSPTPTTNPPSEPVVKKGNYATAVNIHNPWSTPVTITKQVVISAREVFPDTPHIAPSKRVFDTLLAGQAMYVDCQEMVHLLVLGGSAVPSPFMEGFVVIDAYSSSSSAGPVPTDVDVVAVTTTSPANIPSAPGGDVNSHEITTVQGRKLPKGNWPF